MEGERQMSEEPSPSWRHQPRTRHDNGDELDAEKALNTALAKAQGEFPPIPRERTVQIKTQGGGTYSYSYAPLDVILAAVRPVLARHGLSLIQRLDDENGRPAIRTEIRHAEGGKISASFLIGDRPPNPQQLGSLLTYLRRYTIQAMLGIAPEEDDDGQAAAKTKTKGSVGEPQAGPDLPPVSRAADEDALTGPSDEPASPTEEPKLISEQQRKMMWGIAHARGFADDDLRAIVAKHTGQSDSTAEIPVDKFQHILADLKTEDDLIT
jgi:hypothetical protein